MKQETNTPPQVQARATLKELLARYYDSAYMYHRMFDYYGLGAWFDADREWASHWGVSKRFFDGVVDLANKHTTYTVYLIADIDLPDALFNGTLDECQAYLKGYREDHPRILPRYFSIQENRRLTATLQAMMGE
jgi:hypothetical protein